MTFLGVAPGTLEPVNIFSQGPNKPSIITRTKQVSWVNLFRILARLDLNPKHQVPASPECQTNDCTVGKRVHICHPCPLKVSVIQCSNGLSTIDHKVEKGKARTTITSNYITVMDTFVTAETVHHIFICRTQKICMEFKTDELYYSI